MKFRIRDLETDDRTAYEAAESAYRSHLDRFDKSSNGDLWKYFYWDFFHDGGFSGFVVGNDLKTATLTIEAPNIKRHLPGGGFEYETATFECTFCNVVYLAVETTPPGEWRPNEVALGTFLASEINTSTLPQTVEGEDFYSLLVEAMAGDSHIWVEMIFSQVNVTATEPLAFALMEASDQFEVPVYRIEKARTQGSSGPRSRAAR